MWILEVMDDSTHQFCAGFQYKPIFNVLASFSSCTMWVFWFFFPKSLENWQFDFLLVKAAEYQVHLHLLKGLSDLGK